MACDPGEACRPSSIHPYSSLKEENLLASLRSASENYFYARSRASMHAALEARPPATRSPHRS
eukprot:CAMPEP_0185207346 /NCGR_PEP_ID=MMETSP1140-20130426/60107_1 /TAXON_ID=298111 /ORGANISM="Pavlova sp., Strain CCMP459" /LENGTH=62 /DNA_ID=CAMNT_0027775029 /DNA_START=200 /DNA_END=384 /DNA_ORIENTATION=+